VATDTQAREDVARWWAAHDEDECAECGGAEDANWSTDEVAEVVWSALGTAAWCQVYEVEVSEDGESELVPADDWSADDIAAVTAANLAWEVVEFCHDYAEDIRDSGLTPEQVGHDFMLTRNGHGAGFWDRGLGAVGDRLSEGARPYGEFMLYVAERPGGDGDLFLTAGY
jgi:hypothetical protein